MTPILNALKAITSFAGGKAAEGIKLISSGFEKFVSILAKGLSALTESGRLLNAFSAAFIAFATGSLFSSLKNFTDLMNKTINSVRLEGGLKNIIDTLTRSSIGTDTFTVLNKDLWDLKTTLTAYQKTISAGTLQIIAAAILELAIAVKILSTIQTGRLASAVVGVEALMQVLVVASRSMQAAQTQGIIKISLAIRILASAMKVLGDLSVGDIAKGVAAIGILMQMLIKTSLYASVIDPGSMNKVAKTFVIYALALRMMVKPIKQIGEMKVQDIAKGLITVAVALQIMSRTAKSFSSFKPGQLLKAAAAMMIFGIAINELVIPIELLGHMDVKQLGKGLGAIAVVLLELGLFTAAMTKVGYMGMEMMMLAPALVGMAKALVIIGAALALMGNTANIGTGLSVLFSSLLILSAAMYAMQKALPGAAAMIVVAAALAIIAPPLALLSSLSFGGVITGLIALAGAITIFGAAALVLTAAWSFFLPGVAILTALAAAIALVGVGVLALGAGMTMLATAFQTGTDSIIEGLTALAAMLPTVTGYLWDFIKGMLTGFIENAPLIVNAFTVLIDSCLQALWNNVPKMAVVGLALIVALLTAIRDKIGDITNLAIDIGVNFLAALASRVGEFSMAGADLMIAFFNSMADTTATKGPELIASIENVMLSVLEVIVGQIPFFGKGAAEAIEAYRQGLDSGKGNANKTAKSISSSTESNLKISNQRANGSNASSTLNSGLLSNKGSVSSTASSISSTADTNMQIPSQYSNGYNAGSGLVSGLNSCLPSLRSVANTIGSLVDSVIRKKNKIHSPSKVMMQNGRYMMQGLIAGLDSLTPEYQNRANNISTVLIGSTNDAIDAMNAFNGMSLSGAISQSQDVNLRMNDIRRENDKLASGITKLNSTLSSMTESMNSRSLNVYNTIDGATDPEAFADGLIRSFRLNARTT